MLVELGRYEFKGVTGNKLKLGAQKRDAFKLKFDDSFQEFLSFAVGWVLGTCTRHPSFQVLGATPHVK